MSSGDDKERLELRADEVKTEEGTEPEQRLYLDRGRTLDIAKVGLTQVLEIRAESGQLELRVRLTEDGPVLQLDGAKIAVTAEDTVAVKCKTFTVESTEATVIQSHGEMKIKSEGELEVDSPSDIKIRGKMIYLN
jgi:hypothetical protein